MSDAKVAVIVPTCKLPGQVAALMNELYEASNRTCRIFIAASPGSAACNRNNGLRGVSADIVAMVDDDIRSPNKDWLTHLIAPLIDDPDVIMTSAQLYHEDGTYAYMMGLSDTDLPPREHGITVLPVPRLLTACCAFRNDGTRFDEGYVGSGFEDTDFCRQLALKYPHGKFVVCHDAHVVHISEQKNQNVNLETNRAYFVKKWGIDP